MKKELPVINNQEGNFIAGNCFYFYAFSEKVDEHGFKEETENITATHNFARGLQSLHQGHWAGTVLNFELQDQKYQRAFAYFHQALSAKPDYFCARQALSSTALLLGYDDVAENEAYAIRTSNNPHPELPCHLLHPGFHSASDLSKLEESLRERK